MPLSNATSAISFRPDRDTALVCAAALLLAIWPLPETILLRNFALLAGFCLDVVQLWLQFRRGALVQRYWPAAVLLAFFPWLLWHLWVWPTLVEEQLYDLSGDWFRAFCACVGFITLSVHESPQTE